MMVHPRVPQAQIYVDGVVDGEPVMTFRLAHGELPDLGLRARGWEPVRARDVVGQSDPHELRLVYDVRRSSPPVDDPPHGEPPVRRDDDLVVVAGEAVVPYQRVAAYGIVTSSRGVLLSRFAGSTNAAGEWGLVGGGVDPGELPQAALHREVWEESGQVVEVTGLATITSSHWVGRAPHGRLEDFHAVRIAYWARCPHPTDPVVHDVGGTTAESAWVTVSELGSVGLVASWAVELPRLLAARG
ncbi:MAG: NUDIX domain-containing protein [Actinomycetota bacterium]|nr:NUDIX domain-containing protein [Actinomycetota bacterium]